MKWWLLPASVGLFLAGATAGGISKPLRSPPNPRAKADVAANVPRSPDKSPDSVEAQQAPKEQPPIRCGSVARPDDSRLTPRARALRRLLDRLDPAKIRSCLWAAVNDDPVLQRRAFDLYKESGDPVLWEQLKSLFKPIRNPEVAAEALHLMQVERDPVRRRFLAGLMAEQNQPEAFGRTALDLLSDRDPEVVRLVLKEMALRRIQVPEDRRRAAAQIHAAVASVNPKPLRLQALESMSGSEDPQDIRCLLDVIHREKDGEIAMRAMNSLPWGIGGDSKLRDLAVESVVLLYGIAADGSRTLTVRRQAATSALRIDSDDDDTILGTAEKSFLASVKEIEGR